MLEGKCIILLLAGIGITMAVTAPEFRNIGDLNNMLVSENTPVGESIFQIRAYDPDGNALDFTISGDTFRISPAGVNAQGETLGDLEVAKILDRETNPVVRFDVSITDGLGGHTITHSDILINVIDYNDNSPQFQGTPYEARLSENADIGTSIITVRATDIDSGQNGAVNYQLTSHTDSFEIGQVDGILRLKDRTAIESEQQTAYAVTVRAVDGGSQPLATSVDVFVQITDEQNRAPVWLNEPYEISITEGTPGSLQAS
ncbi:CDH23 [Branchiostoma lanceolatum]|uniref:CDH23 protein n=1 Tax=Branchiostoma lanceolatum TaxID=7740 RepID=A0A8J9Z3I2_BRALA|nr:CDH23 [Branchiostoma lanceolatum]